VLTVPAARKDFYRQVTQRFHRKLPTANQYPISCALNTRYIYIYNLRARHHRIVTASLIISKQLELVIYEILLSTHRASRPWGCLHKFITPTETSKTKYGRTLLSTIYLSVEQSAWRGKYIAIQGRKGVDSSHRPRDNSHIIQCTAVNTKVWGEPPAVSVGEIGQSGGILWKSYTQNRCHYNSLNVCDRLLNFVKKSFLRLTN
jgi:hypothetical protein